MVGWSIAYAPLGLGNKAPRSYKLAMDLPTIPYIIGDIIIFFHSMSYSVTPPNTCDPCHLCYNVTDEEPGVKTSDLFNNII